MSRLHLNLCGAAALLVSTSSAQVTQLVSGSIGGSPSNAASGSASVSADGRFVAFESDASDLVTGDTNSTTDVFLHDRQTGMTERVSLGVSGAQGNSASTSASISADARYVAFKSRATNLVPGDTNGFEDIFVRDRQSGTTERVSVATGSNQSDDDSSRPSISADGRFVAFESAATNLVGGDTNGFADVFVRDRQSGTTELVSVGTGGVPANSYSLSPSISADGRFVAFQSFASNLVAGDTNGAMDVFVRDRQNGTTLRASVATNGTQGNSDSLLPFVSASGGLVAFESVASNLVAGDTNNTWNVFVHDLQSGITERVSVATIGTEGNDGSFSPALAADGRFVVFESDASNLVAGDTNAATDIFVRDRTGATTDRVSVATDGTQGNAGSHSPWISADGRFVAFESDASNLIAGDTNGRTDVFVRDLDAAGFTSLCTPGVDGVIACPCTNPPSGLGRGCDNSSATGGASVSASGVAYLSMDSLMCTTSGEGPVATSVLMQGNTFDASGLVFGQGVRCAGGALERLYTKSAVGGSIIAPDLGAGDPSVSARSAALGDVIQAGQSRWYLVYYRDPVVLGGCSHASTFNATQTGRVLWSL